MAFNQTGDIQVHDVLIVGAGPCGLAVAARLREHMPAANFSDDEHQRYHWIQKHRNQTSIKNYRTGAEIRPKKSCTSPSKEAELDLLVLDATDNRWMARWDTLFKTFDISHLRSPMFFHVDPSERDGLLAYTYRNERGNELTELRGTEPTVDERDRNDYFVPSTPLFASHCGCLMDRYSLQENIVRHEKVEDIQFDYNEDISETDKIFTVRTNNGTHYARTMVLAVGGNPPQIPDMPSEGIEAITHAMHIKEMPSPHVRAKLKAKQSTHIVIVGGGLTSAQLADLAIRRGVTKVWLLMRGPLKVKYFDIGLEWVGKFRNFEQAAFWSSDSVEERWEKVHTARNGGSITPRYKKILERHIASGRLCMLQNTTIKEKQWDAASKTWTVDLSDEAQTPLPRIDHIYFATGVQSNFACLPFLHSICADYPIQDCGGFPCITENMAWRDDVPLFVAGRFAALQLGPGAPNLIGARIGAERIAWSIQDVLGTKDSAKSGGAEFDYLTGRGSRFDALAEAV
ncbi:FAD/NAD(P)-binding domain-containing protein [Hypoxylon fragiforme]|uniref:FAD/NAD(P)-binding domain-containing protein n=1 Tax=Hypoxylon fragiforme TaxID=63214 RepID=UPI0020C5D670|nr:FAD/NAD(P)-binding domain-containing protein [Hypoxylon fragiforme]KAI2607154.1 FAD/NAD(P)-binding domain-containing protein [Hypoxylon fragiforme]